MPLVAWASWAGGRSSDRVASRPRGCEVNSQSSPCPPQTSADSREGEEPRKRFPGGSEEPQAVKGSTFRFTFRCGGSWLPLRLLKPSVVGEFSFPESCSGGLCRLLYRVCQNLSGISHMSARRIAILSVNKGRELTKTAGLFTPPEDCPRTNRTSSAQKKPKKRPVLYSFG